MDLEKIETAKTDGNKTGIPIQLGFSVLFS
jgi:hypothetical protein